MLRAVVFLLILANAALLAWSQGWMPLLGTLPSESGRETHRLDRQLRPEAVVLVPDGPATAGTAVAAAPPASLPALPGASPSPDAVAAAALVAASATPSPAAVAAEGEARASGAAPVAVEAGEVCLEAAYFTEAELREVERGLGTLASKRQDWTVRAVPAPGTWLVYMGPFPNAQEFERKQQELRRMGLGFEEVRNPPSLAPGMALARFNDPAKANDRLAELQRKGVRTAQVQAAVPARTLYAVRIGRADARLQGVAQAARPALAGRRFLPCP